MTASVVAKYAFVPIASEVASNPTPHVAKPVQNAANSAHARVHASATTHATVQHSTAKSVKTTHAPTSQQAKASGKSSHAVPHNMLRLVALPRGVKPNAGGGPVAGALTPIQVTGAYGVTNLGVSNQGQGQTIGIIDLYNDPSIVGDANVFSTQYNLPNFNVAGGPTLTVFKDTTFGQVPNSPIGPFNGGTTPETSLDVEWAHAVAPKANILLVEVPALPVNNGGYNALLEGVQYAAAHGASVISVSYGNPETEVGLPALYRLDQSYLATGAASTAAVTVSTGDNSLPSFPASSPNVIGVGGTALHVTPSNGYAFETAWGGPNTFQAGGGGTTAFFRFPTFQSINGITNYNGHRNLPDVSLIADPNTGVSFYDSYDTSTNNGNPWSETGGTSLAAPVFAAELSLVQQLRVAASKPILSSVQINNAMYALYNSPNYLTYFHDITQGNNSYPAIGIIGYTATTGYDLATGIGSPIANTLVPYLASL